MTLCIFGVQTNVMCVLCFDRRLTGELDFILIIHQRFHMMVLQQIQTDRSKLQSFCSETRDEKRNIKIIFLIKSVTFLLCGLMWSKVNMPFLPNNLKSTASADSGLFRDSNVGTLLCLIGILVSFFSLVNSFVDC